MSLDLHISCDCKRPCCRKDLAWLNITHNLGTMFREAGAYEILWHGNGLIAKDVAPTLKTSLELMKADPARFKKFDSDNGWGTYPDAIEFLEKVVETCEKYPDGILYCSI